MKKYLWAISYGLALTAFTAYIALDTFVISHKMQTDATKMNTSMFDSVSQADITADNGENTEAAIEGADSDTAAVGTFEGGNEYLLSSGYTPLEIKQQADYKDENISITLSEFFENDTHIYVADVYLTSAQYLKTAFAEDTYGRNITAYTSEIAEEHGAVFAVNGDYYGAQESGYVIRNGIAYRSGQTANDVLCIYATGDLAVISSAEKTTDQLIGEGVWQAFSFGPAIVLDSKVSVTKDQEVGKAMSSNPRTAIGQLGPLHYIFVVSDGRTSESEGLTLYQLGKFMQKLGAVTAYNLDGGGSSSMYFMGEVINQPTSSGRSIKERGVSDIVYIS